jgi:signal transduction histidine kinase/CheY-like chemotaxis protein/purine-cytosine permease-like protein
MDRPGPEHWLMNNRQRIVRVRREYNQWVGNQTLEDYSLRFTAKRARRWSSMRVANTALGAISFLALEAIGGTITLNYGFTNAAAAILLVGLLIFAAGLPIAYYAARYGVDIDLLTRGAGFGYIGSTITSLIYASFTFIFFAIEAAILATMLETCFGLPPWIGYILCSIVVIPLVTHGITFISRFQRWSQPLWAVLQVLPFPFIAAAGMGSFREWTGFPGIGAVPAPSFDLLMFGAAGSVVFSLVAQIGEQVDFLRFLPVAQPGRRLRWWAAMVAAGPGWIVIGVLKLLAGSFLAFLALRQGVLPAIAAQPTEMYRVAFGYVLSPPGAATVLAALFVGVSQVKINITNAYAGSIAWSNFFSRLTHSHPGRVVWLVFNVAVALLLMELGIYQAIEHILSLYAHVAAAWVGALVADLVLNKPLGLSPPYIEFKRAHLYDFNPVGVGAMALAVAASVAAHAGLFGPVVGAFTPFLAFAVAFLAAPLIAVATRGRYYLARKPRAHWARESVIRCCICEHPFEPEDMAFCPVYSGPICSLCCSLDARCEDSCKPAPQLGARLLDELKVRLPAPLGPILDSALWRFLGVFGLFSSLIGVILLAICLQAEVDVPDEGRVIGSAFWKAFFIMVPIVGVAAWLLVLAHKTRQMAQEESRRQTALLMHEIRAHKRTDAELQKAKEAAEAANLAKSRYVVGLSHELRTPLNAVLGYAQLLERDKTIPERRRGAVRLIRRSGEHLAGLIEGLLDISKIEAGRIEVYRDQVRLGEFLDQLVGMFRLQAEAKGIGFMFTRAEHVPEIVYTDEKRLRQILINLLTNAIKFTSTGSVSLRLRWRSPIAEFEVEDTGPGIMAEDQARIFEPFQRVGSHAAPGVGLGLTITRLLTQIMGGDISLTSTPGQGSLFRVRLMLSEAAMPAASAGSEPDILGYQGRRMTVLVVDDDMTHRGLIEDVLSPIGFTILGAPDGPSCLELAAQTRVDLFLIDISMPGMDGWDLARRLRQAGYRETPIVIVSANAGELGALNATERNHDEVLAKPISIPLLLDQIGRLLGIDWLATIPAEPDAPRASPSPPDGVLTRRHLADLRQLGAIGYVRGIQARLDELEDESPLLEPYVAHLKTLVGEFRLPEFMAALDAVDAGAEVR